MAQSYKERLLLPLVTQPDDVALEFSTANGLILARGYIRVCIGGRGPYVEFSDDQIIHDAISKIEASEEGKFHYYYVEYRSKDEAYVKLYHQIHEVDYADYKPGFWYIDPFRLTTNKYPILIKPIEKKVKVKHMEPEINFE